MSKKVSGMYFARFYCAARLAFNCRYRMSSVYKFHDFLHPICILRSLFELQSTGSLCDVTLAVNGDEIRAHKVVLASASPYFR
jgi:hypothetical protein